MEAPNGQAAQSELPWNSLPQHLMEPIVIQVEAVGGQRALASMRLVSKSWHAAVTASSIALEDVKIKGQEDVLQLGKIAPNLAILGLVCQPGVIDLELLTTFSQLTALSLDGQAHPEQELPHADISALSGRLRRLEIQGTYLPPVCFADLKIVDLTFLSFAFLENKKPEIWTLLQQLPELKELELVAPYFWKSAWQDSLETFEIFFQEATTSLQGLTRLQLSFPVLKAETIACYCPPDLQDVTFYSAQFSRPWLNLFTKAAVRLTRLKLSGCLLSVQTLGPLKASETLRCLELEDSNLKFLDLGDSKLQSLSLLQSDWKIISPALPQLCLLRGLTRLELTNIECSNCCKFIRHLPLQELVFLNCQGAELQLFNKEPNMLTSLRRLHIEDRSCNDDEGHLLDHEALPKTRKEAQVKKAGSVILRLPHLHSVSGWCELYKTSMRQDLESWQKFGLSEGTMVSDKGSHCCPVSRMKLWFRS